MCAPHLNAFKLIKSHLSKNTAKEPYLKLVNKEFNQERPASNFNYDTTKYYDGPFPALAKLTYEFREAYHEFK